MKREYRSFDFILLIAVCALIFLGIAVIASATNPSAANHDLWFRQTLFFGLGFIMLLLAAFIDYHFICRFYILIYVVCVALLVGILVYNQLFVGATVARWFHFGPVNIQPSEVAKIFLIIFLAAFIDRQQERLNHPLIVLFLAGAVAAPVLLVVAQPSLTSAIVLAFLSVSILYIGGISIKYILPVVLIVIPIAVFVYQDVTRETPLLLNHFLEPYHITRIQTFLGINQNPDDMFQTGRSVQALASGQFAGQGFMQGRLTQIGGIPEAQTDFIFSVIGEEFGFIGAAAVLALSLFIIIKCLLTAQTAVDLPGKLMAVGVASMFAFQVFTNVSVATDNLPNTGVPFPFVSYGGSSLLINMIAIGLVINIGMSKPKSFFG